MEGFKRWPFTRLNKLLQTRKFNEYLPKMMVWKHVSPFKSWCHFWYLYIIKFEGSTAFDRGLKNYKVRSLGTFTTGLCFAFRDLEQTHRFPIVYVPSQKTGPYLIPGVRKLQQKLIFPPFVLPSYLRKGGGG